jgi:hypothetical protein
MRITALELAHKFRHQQIEQEKWAQKLFGTIEDGHFTGIAINKEEYVLAPYPEFTAFIFRGQKQYYEPCLSSLHRTFPNQIERFIADMRVSEFQLLLSDHPAIIDFSNLPIMGLRFRIDYEALAQHYGLHTRLIDFTSNPYVAAFFACCEYDNAAQEYRPILRAKHKGVMYSYLAVADMIDSTGLAEPFSSVVGLQPLRRPAEQYAWCYRLSKRASLNSQPNVTYEYFIHDPKASIKVFDQFEGGEKIFPYDPVSEKTRQIFSTREFSRSAYQMTLSKYAGRMKERSTLNILKRKGITIIDKAKIGFTRSEMLQIENDWIERRSDLTSRIHFRKAYYPPDAKIDLAGSTNPA